MVALGIWTPTVQRNFLIEERCNAYAKAMKFTCPPAYSYEGMEYRLEMQESTARAIGVLFMLFPLGAMLTKSVEYLNIPDMDFAHRIPVLKPLSKKDSAFNKFLKASGLGGGNQEPSHELGGVRTGGKMDKAAMDQRKKTMQMLNANHHKVG
jgi:hypothetical protein